MSSEVFRDWIKVAGVVAVTVVAIFGLFVTKSEMKAEFKAIHTKLDALNSKMDNMYSDMREMRSDIKQLNQNYINHLASHNKD